MLKVLAILPALFAACFSALTYGPCHPVSTVNLDINKWPGQYFVNVMTSNVGVRCMFVDRELQWNGTKPANPTKENTLIGEVFKRIENGTNVESTVQGIYVGNGHYRFSKELTPGNIITFEANWLHFNLPDLDCHYVCSNDERLKNGRGAFFCESAYPDALKKNACKIKKIAESNGFDINDLMVVDNCNCPNIPIKYKSKCKQTTITEYFKDCVC